MGEAAMPTRSDRRYRGKIKAVVFDWAGTVIDYGSCAPAGVFVEVFKRNRVAITLAEARGPMGMEKRAHIASIAAMPGVSDRWRQANGRALGDVDIDRMYDEFLPLQIASLPNYSNLIPGALEAVAALRARGIKVGSSTGYSRRLMDVVEFEARRRGFEPDVIVCADDVPAGRPAPWMCFENMKRLGVWPAEACIKVDDTLPGIEAGANAGMWTVGVVKTGNELGFSEQELESLPPAEYESRVGSGRQRMLEGGAHFVIDGVADLMPVIDDIELRLQRGERP
jgi:phosphonoacetaldehyde hydrolase